MTAELTDAFYNEINSKMAEEIARLTEEVERLQAVVDAAEQNRPRLGDNLLGEIEACIIENTGDGVLAAYVAKWLDGEPCPTCKGLGVFGTSANSKVCPDCGGTGRKR